MAKALEIRDSGFDSRAGALPKCRKFLKQIVHELNHTPPFLADQNEQFFNFIPETSYNTTDSMSKHVVAINLLTNVFITSAFWTSFVMYTF